MQNLILTPIALDQLAATIREIVRSEIESKDRHDLYEKLLYRGYGFLVL